MLLLTRSHSLAGMERMETKYNVNLDYFVQISIETSTDLGILTFSMDYLGDYSTIGGMMMTIIHEDDNYT